MTISGDIIGELEKFKYLGSFIQRDRGFVVDVKYRIKRRWMKWRVTKGVLQDERDSIRPRGKFYKRVARLTTLYGSECWVVDLRI